MRVYLHGHSIIYSLSKNLMTVCFGQDYRPVNVSCIDTVPVCFRLTAAHIDPIIPCGRLKLRVAPSLAGAMATDWKRWDFRTKGLDSSVRFSLYSCQPIGSLGTELRSQALGPFIVLACLILRSITTVDLDVRDQSPVEGVPPRPLECGGGVGGGIGYCSGMCNFSKTTQLAGWTLQSLD